MPSRLSPDTLTIVTDMHFLAFFLAMIISAPAFAESVPVPPQKTQSIEILKDKIASEEAQQKKLSQKLKEAEKGIAAAKSDMATLSAQIRKNENGQRDLEKRVSALSEEEETLTKRLETDHGSIAGTILALERMRRVPPELLIVRPGAPLETAQTALLLQSMLPALNQRAQALARDLERLHEVQKKLDNDRQELLATKAALDKQNTELARLMDAREKEARSTNAAYRDSTVRAERFAAEAQSLSELVRRIEEDTRRTASAKEPDSAEPFKPVKKRAVTPLKGLGKGIWPVSGRTIAQFGDQDEMGGEVLGIKIGATPKAVVVTPLKGTIKYAGTFRNYGELVIVDHDNGYHSLIAGLSRAQVAIGQSLKAGDPLGYMPSSSSQATSQTLYYELRRDGQAVDPAYLFADLRS